MPLRPPHPHIWHPYTDHSSAQVLPIVKAEGSYLWDDDGKRYTDMISSWWVSVHGHRHPAVMNAITEQIATLDHVMFAGFTHPSAERLTDALISLLNQPFDEPHFDKVFYSDNGSTAVEIALKCALQFQQLSGASRKQRILALSGAYHGDTFGAMSVGRSSFFTAFEEQLFEVHTINIPEYQGENDYDHESDATQLEAERKSLNELEALLTKYPGEFCACIVEPLVLGSSGMRMYSPNFLRSLTTAVQESGALLISDEVFTGFGRTGALWAYERAGIRPDIVCLSKGLTGGAVPLGATAFRRGIFERFLSPHTPAGVPQFFPHGHSYTAYAIGCAAAHASCNLFATTDYPTKWRSIEESYRRHFVPLGELPGVSSLRILGCIAALNVTTLGGGYGSQGSKALRESFLRRGFLIRPLGEVIYLMPPYCISGEDIAGACGAIREVVLELS